MSDVPPIERPPLLRSRGGVLPARCKQCFYVIENLPDQRCPECGQTFDPADPNTYTVDAPPMSPFWHWTIALGAASLMAAIVAGWLLAQGAWGAALWVGVPMGAAVIIGYAVRPRLLTRLLLLIALGGIIILIFFMGGIAGVFCALILVAIIFVPLVIGCALGAALRVVVRESERTRGRNAWIIVIAASIPLGWGLIEGRPVPMAHEAVATSRIINAPVDVAWDSIMFYEQVEHKPPLILRIGLAHPLATNGSSQRVGDIKTCYYNKGHFTKQVTHIDELRRFDFAIIEQDIGYERDVRLTGGSFVFEPVNDHQTRITLRTDYEPLLAPRFAWRWGERYAFRTLHGHVLEGMARRAQQHEAPTEVVALRRTDEVDRE